MRYLIILFVLLSVSYGCAPSQPLLVRHSYATNYKIGKTETAYVGQSVLKVKDYYFYKDYEKTFFEATNNFLLNAKIPEKKSVYNLTIIGQKGKTYEPYYRERVNGIMHYIMYFSDSNGNDAYGVLIDDAGNIQTDMLYGNIKPIDFELIPPDTKLIKSSMNTESFACYQHHDYYSNICGWVNFELIYGGINSVSLNMSYKEYSREDYARTAFYQDLTFEPNAKQIRFKDFIIKIIEATNDKLVYQILADNLKDDEFYEGNDPAFNRIYFPK